MNRTDRLPSRPAAHLRFLEQLVEVGRRLPADEAAALEAWEHAHPGERTSRWPGWARHLPRGREVA